MSREAMQMALEALEKVITAFGSGLTLQQNAITALRQALEEKPPKREWVGLTDEEIYDCEEEVGMPQYEISSADLYAFARAIEAKLKEKSHG